MLHGKRCSSAGVCDHQGWSEAMVVLPVLAGMLGLHPDATAGVLRLSPSLPAEWPFLLVEGIRIGDALIDVQLERRGDQIATRARLRRGQRVILALRLPGVPEQKVILRGVIG